MEDSNTDHNPTGWRVGTGHLTHAGNFAYYKGSELLDTPDAVREHVRKAAAEHSALAVFRPPADKAAEAIADQFGDGDAGGYAWNPLEDFYSHALLDGVRFWVEPVFRVLTIAEKYAAVAHEPYAWAEREPWERRIPSVIYPNGKPGDVLDKFFDVAQATGDTLSDMDGERDGYLYSALCQDAAAVATGMPEDRRVTCAEHRTWRTAAHLAEMHTDQSA